MIQWSVYQSLILSSSSFDCVVMETWLQESVDLSKITLSRIVNLVQDAEIKSKSE